MHPQHAVAFFRGQRRERVVIAGTGVERCFLWPTDQPPVQTVAPGVIGADEAAALARAFGHTRAPMTTHVEKSLEAAVLLAGEQQGQAAGVVRQLVARGGEIATQPDAQRPAAEQLCALARGLRLVGVFGDRLAIHLVAKLQGLAINVIEEAVGQGQLGCFFHEGSCVMRGA